ncbi:hypothetical protein WOLCODRAFT_97559 [Wolfiporia cocos MD-104 SS10]|uniref:Peptidase S9 prolyl oligopeptidase catalytic domain-containing protein n=1 Tax=Wolfiporia cocos (strain MD-104) TaxID=742152 RepID=A0A2H3JPY4_WOLCO|nr:hypothetical protein WOLCODRAFT_97559 [Wolfiporia cocos MD-104 SS10]
MTRALRTMAYPRSCWTSTFWFSWVLALVMASGGQQQTVFDASFASLIDAGANGSIDWRVSVSKDWDVLGPFPIHAREQHFLSPAFPLNLSEPLDHTAQWPSSYADNGTVGWTTARARDDGTLDVSFPEIRWSSLRATEGWAALQSHSVLHTTITIYPPPSQDGQSANPPKLLVDLLQGSFFTVLPPKNHESTEGVVPTWYAGNIYAMDRAPPQVVPLPRDPSATEPTAYDLFVSGDYEIRLFGDPLFNSRRDGIPVLSLTLSASLLTSSKAEVILLPSHDVTCDFADGWAFGDALGVGVRSLSGWWTVGNVSLTTITEPSPIELQLLNATRIAPSQTRIVPIRISQRAAYYASSIELDLHLTSSTTLTTLHVILPVTQLPQWTPSNSPSEGIMASYFFATSMPTAFRVIPPELPNDGDPHPAVLALHGAGVDIITMPFWIQALPRQERSWVIAPTGRTAWGLDWHGPSTQDAWSTVDALYAIVASRESWHLYMLAENTRVLVLGHSNGGQGAWYIASRYPDRVAAAIPAAGYIKSQSYVPLIHSRSAHYIDPPLRAILESSLTPDDNDLFMSNLVDTPILAIHGGDDENVPVWHTREAVSVLKTWDPNANATYVEDQGQTHWYPAVFDNDHVKAFMRSLLEQGAVGAVSQSKSFTLTVSVPSDSGAMHGWRILSLQTPGRLARLTVRVEDDLVSVRTTNVKSFSIHRLTNGIQLTVDDRPLHINETINDPVVLQFSIHDKMWTVENSIVTPNIQNTGRLSNILNSVAPLLIVIPDNSTDRMLSVAGRIAHNLDIYHKLDAEIIFADEALRRLQTGSLGRGNIVAFGDVDNSFTRHILVDSRTPFQIHGTNLFIKGRQLGQPSAAALFLHPHPSVDSALVMIVFAGRDSGLEKGLRLCPIRTGVTVPDWLLIGTSTDAVGAAGIDGAGVWGVNWDWNEAMSWL